MHALRLLLTAIACSIAFYSSSQNLKQYEALKKKGDSAYTAKNFPLSIEYYEKSIALAENLGLDLSGELYDLACVYSLNRQTENALRSLTRSFEISNLYQKKPPVSLTHIISDSDLDFIRSTAVFNDLLRKYYPKFDVHIALDKEISYDDVLQFIKIHSTDPINVTTIPIKDKVIYWKKIDTSFVFNKKRLTIPNDAGLAQKPIEFINCIFKLNFLWSAASDFDPPTGALLAFRKCTFNGRFAINAVILRQLPNFYDCVFKDDFWMSTHLDEPGYMEFSNCTLKTASIFIHSTALVNFNLIGTSCQEDFDIRCPHVNRAKFINNKLDSGNLIISFEEVESLKFEDNRFNNVVLIETNVSSEFDYLSSPLRGKLLFMETSFANNPANDIDWKNIDSLRIGLGNYIHEANYRVFSDEAADVTVQKDPTIFGYNSGEKEEDVSNEKSFSELMGLYSMFLNFYKEKNDIEPYNRCFIMVKELQSKRLEYLYRSHKTFETYFRWKLASLLKFYVRHGTDPARAIVISFYIIFLFGIFFFFFPSDWDITSKSRLIENFKDFIHKNDKGYIIPFFALIGGLALSLLNALTLSLNAFITLGFGNIPTHGIARYVCVLEGFMGWFLLSIFTVALINQVL